MSDAIEQFWQNYLATLPTNHPHHHATYIADIFGDSPVSAENLGQLIVQGVKTSTCSLLWEYEFEGDTPPYVGMVQVVLGGADQPLCIIETTSIEIMPFNAVSAQHAYDEGEGDRSLAYWREVHWQFFSRVCEHIGREPSETMPLVCEYFKVIA